MITFGNTSIEISVIAGFAVILIFKFLPIVAAIWFVVQGFRVHWGWGLANLFIPGAIIPFCIFHLKEAKRPLILTGVWLGGFLILWIWARHGSSSRPIVEVAPALSASARNAVLHLELDSSFNEVSRTEQQVSGILSRKMPVMPFVHSDDRYDEERLIAIKADGFVIRFTDRVGGEVRTNFALFPYGETTETNILGWDIIGDYSGKVTSQPTTALKPTADNVFHLSITNGFASPSVGGGSALYR